MNPEGVAAEIGITVEGVHRRIAAGQITATTRDGALWIEPAEVARFRSMYIAEMAKALANDF